MTTGTNAEHGAKPLHATCGAKTRDGDPCKLPPVIGAGRCRMHGGKSPRGAASPHYKDGRHSRHLPPRLLERYVEAAQDGELLSLRDEIALTDARLADVLSRVDQGESGERWRAVRSAWRTFVRHQARGDRDGARQAIIGLGETISSGVADYDAWTDVRSLLDQRLRLVEGERRRLEALQAHVTAEQACALVANVQQAVLKHVHDPAILRAIVAELDRLTALQPGQRPN